jgi:pimeloyl-ACP methyl ester carboxylesterase
VRTPPPFVTTTQTHFSCKGEFERSLRGVVLFCDLGNVSIYYETCGDGIPVLMIHGFYPDHRLMKGCMEPIFANRPGWKRIYFDLPGMGRTGGEPWIDCSDKVLEVVLAFVDRILPNQSFLVVGESYGGYLARALVLRKRESVHGLLLICPLIVADHEKRSLPPRRIIVEDRRLMSELDESDANEFASMAVIQTRRNWERFRDEILVALKVADVAYLERLRSRGYPFSFDVNSLREQYDKPVLIVAGRQDTSVGYRDAWGIIENYPRATLAVLDSAGHNLQIEQAQVFTALVLEWLDRVRRKENH